MEDIASLDISTASEGGSLLAVKAVPGAKRPRIVGIHSNALKVAVAEPPEGGAANRAVCRLVADRLGLAKGTVTVHAGHASPWKTLHCASMASDDLRRMLAEQ